MRISAAEESETDQKEAVAVGAVVGEALQRFAMSILSDIIENVAK